MSHKTYLAGFIIIGVKGLFHSGWLGAGPASLLLAHSWEQERQGNLAIPLPAL
jgi:hypothetical protein